MSYCRFGVDGSDVYCFHNGANNMYDVWYLDEEYQVGTPEEAIELLETLRDRGAYVPQYAIDRLAEEANGAVTNDRRCPHCHFGDLMLTPAGAHLHCAVCGHLELVPREDDDE